jgi:predicted Kef-type K+ transport protein
LDFTWVSITYSATAWIGIIFALGLLAKQVGLPPLVGFLIAGFIMNQMGMQMTAGLSTIADLGITLLLFTIGLKLNFRSLMRAHIWGVTSLHVLLVVCVAGSIIWLLGLLGLQMFAGLNWSTAALLAFAMSFSSTVFAVKVLEEKGELAANHGRIAIGILIMQDVFAVVFLTLSTGKIPSPWAVVLLGVLIVARPLFGRLMNRVGHGELLIVYGFILALGGASAFEFVNMKADLGALLMGMILAGHARSSELASSLLSFKDLFLIGFFLTIGLNASLSFDVFLIALLVVLALPVKVILYYWLLTLFRWRARTAFLTSLSLSNYSEFGLIVGAIAFNNGWLTDEWLGVLAISMAITFIIAAPFNLNSHRLYARFDKVLKHFQREERLPEEQTIDTGGAEILVFGMGRVGMAAYDKMRQQFGDVVLGLDHDAMVVETQRKAGRNVIQGDAIDYDFWAKLQPGKVRVVLLDMPNQSENLFAMQQLAASGFKGKVAATAKYDDQLKELRAAGADAAYNIYGEAGSGFANHVSEQLCQDIKFTSNP